MELKQIIKNRPIKQLDMCFWEFEKKAINTKIKIVKINLYNTNRVFVGIPFYKIIRI